MAANTAPIFILQGDPSRDALVADVMPVTLTTAAADFDGTSANNQLIFTAGAEGAYIESIRFKAVGNNPASCARIYINNGATPGTATNNRLIGEQSLLSVSPTAGQSAATVDIDYLLRRALPAGYRIYVGLSITCGGWVCTANAGQY